MKTLLLALALAGPGDDWTAEDTGFQIAMTALIAVDWMQTADFRADGAPEWNPLLGRKPSPQRVNLAIGGAILGSWALAYVLPPPYRRIFQAVVITAEVVSVARNASLGCGLRIPF